jgi:hypothetical protein
MNLLRKQKSDVPTDLMKKEKKNEETVPKQEMVSN